MHIKGLVRWVTDDRYAFKAGEKYQLDVYDARGRVLHGETVALGTFGTIATRFTLPDTAPQGAYRVHLHQPGIQQVVQIRLGKCFISVSQKMNIY